MSNSGGGGDRSDSCLMIIICFALQHWNLLSLRDCTQPYTAPLYEHKWAHHQIKFGTTCSPTTFHCISVFFGPLTADKHKSSFEVNNCLLYFFHTAIYHIYRGIMFRTWIVINICKNSKNTYCIVFFFLFCH